ncbi:unnamed protein product [Rhizophagus irregularis]|nr:unnamed protein product [Rhizophagus irregularis]
MLKTPLKFNSTENFRFYQKFPKFLICLIFMKLKSISKDMVFLNTSWIEFQRNTTLQMLPGWNFEALNRILKVQNVTRLPFQRKPKDKFWTPISKILGSYLKNF